MLFQIPSTDNAQTRKERPNIIGGGEPELIPFNMGGNYAINAFLKFDISGVTGKYINSVKLKLHSMVAQLPVIPYGVDVSRVDNDEWGEGNITWNNSPERKNVLGVITLDAQETPIDRWYECDVTNFVRNEYNNDKIVSLCLSCNEDANSGRVAFVSRNSQYLLKPYLEIETSEEVPLPPEPPPPEPTPPSEEVPLPPEPPQPKPPPPTIHPLVPLMLIGAGILFYILLRK